MSKFLDEYEKLSKEIEEKTGKKLTEVFEEKTSKNFNEFYLSYYDKLVWYLQNKIKSIEVAEDLASEAFMKALSKIDKYDAKYNFSTWLFNIANNMSKDYLIKVNKHVHVSIDSPVTGEGDDITGNNTLSSLLEYKEDTDQYEHNKIVMKHKIMLECIQDLSPKFKEVIELREFENMSYEQIATKLNINESTLKSRIRQGRILLVNAVKNKYNLIDECY